MTPAPAADTAMALATPPRPPSTEAGVIEEARRRHRRRRAGVSLAGLVLLATAAGLLAWLSGATNGSEPNLHLGPEPPLHLGPEPLPLLSARATGEGIRVGVVPNLEPGRPGWCVVALGKETDSYGCRALLTARHPFLGGDGWASAPGAAESTTVLLTAPGVRALSFAGERVGTIAPAGVPFGLRVAVLHQPPSRLPRLIPGHVIPRRAVRISRIHLPYQLLRQRPAAMTIAGRSFTEAEGGRPELPVRYWHLPAAPAHGICELHAAGLPGLTPRWGGVVATLAAFPGELAPGLLPCADTGYSFGAHAIQAAVLLNAADPDTAPPGPLPGFAAIPRAPGFYNSSIACCQGPFTARREGEAWIVAAGGGPNAEEARVRLLQHLTATIEP